MICVTQEIKEEYRMRKKVIYIKLFQLKDLMIMVT